MRTALLLVVLAVAAPLAAATDPFDDALARLRATPGDGYCSSEPGDIIAVVCNATRNGAASAAAAASIARELAVSPETARAIGAAGVAVLIYERENIKPDAAALGRLAESLQATFRREPDHLPAWRMLAALAPLNDDEAAYDRALLPLLRAERNPAAAAAAMVTRWDEVAVRIFLGDVLERQPDSAEAVDAAGRWSLLSLPQAALGPLRFTNRGATLGARADAKQRDADIDRQLDSLSGLGLAEVLLSAYDALPPPLQQHVRGGRWKLDLAAAAIVTGRSELAKTIVRSLPAKVEDDLATAALLRLALDQEKGTFFDTAMLALTDGRALDGIRRRLFALVAERNGEPRFAAELLGGGAPWIDAEIAKAAPEFAPWIAPLAQQLSALRDADRARSAVLAGGEGTSSPRLASLLARPRLVPFTAHALPAVPADEQTKTSVIDCSDPVRAAKVTNLPPFAHLIRMERSGGEVIAVTISSSLDPIGRLETGGYWIVLSHDGGVTWSEYYTSMREYEPYTVTASSALPLLAGDHIRIEVESGEPARKGLYLDFDLAALTSDRDGDGLTDLVEERLVTDPDSADTDGDGIDDAHDLLPQVAWQSGTDARSAAVAAVVGDSAFRRENTAADKTPPSLKDDPIRFLEGDRSLFAPLTMRDRTIVLSGAEVEAYERKFGRTAMESIRYLLVDPSGTRVLVRLDQTTSGRTILLTKTPGGWTTQEVSSWLTCA